MFSWCRRVQILIQFSSETTRLSWRKRNASRTGFKVSKRYADDCWNRWVFRRFLKSAEDDAEMTSVGRLFHRRGEAATPKARSPAVVRRERRTISLRDEADRRRRRAFSQLVSVHFLCIRPLYTKKFVHCIVLYGVIATDKPASGHVHQDLISPIQSGSFGRKLKYEWMWSSKTAKLAL